MALVKHGITKDTPSNIPLGAGTWFKNLAYTEGGWNGTVLGATFGGSSIKITPEILDIEIDGAMAMAKGLAVMQGGSAEAEVNFAEINKDILHMTTLGEVLTSEAQGYGAHCLCPPSQSWMVPCAFSCAFHVHFTVKTPIFIYFEPLLAAV